MKSRPIRAWRRKTSSPLWLRKRRASILPPGSSARLRRTAAAAMAEDTAQNMPCPDSGSMAAAASPTGITDRSSGTADSSGAHSRTTGAASARRNPGGSCPAQHPRAWASRSRGGLAEVPASSVACTQARPPPRQANQSQPSSKGTTALCAGVSAGPSSQPPMATEGGPRRSPSRRDPRRPRASMTSAASMRRPVSSRAPPGRGVAVPVTIPAPALRAQSRRWRSKAGRATRISRLPSCAVPDQRLRRDTRTRGTSGGQGSPDRCSQSSSLGLRPSTRAGARSGSTRTTRAPSLAASQADTAPAGPPPITTRSACPAIARLLARQSGRGSGAKVTFPANLRPCGIRPRVCPEMSSLRPRPREDWPHPARGLPAPQARGPSRR